MIELVSFSIVSSRFIHARAYVRIVFLLKAEGYFIVCIHHILLIHSSVDEQHLDYPYFLAIVDNAAVNMGVCVLQSLLSVLWDIYSEVKWLNLMVTLF